MRNIRVLSIRQPYAEQILLHQKKIGYHGRRTNIRERVYIYARMTPGDVEDWKSLQAPDCR
jgi:hypothetical protein